MTRVLPTLGLIHGQGDVDGPGRNEAGSKR